MVTVISDEEIQMPEDILGYSMVKNGLSQKRVLSINTGLIDPGWHGPISSTIINFGRGNFPLKKGSSAESVGSFWFRKVA